MLEKFLSWLDRLSLRLLAPLAILMASAPWPAGDQPHLIQKIQMLSAGQLTRPIDIFDLFAHGTPLVLLLFKLVRKAWAGSSASDDSSAGEGNEG